MVLYCKEFLRRMVKIGFLHQMHLHKHLPWQFQMISNHPLLSVVKKQLFSESTFQSNEDQSLQWDLKGSKMMKQKSKGAGIMVSDFMDEHSGFLSLTDE